MKKLTLAVLFGMTGMVVNGQLTVRIVDFFDSGTNRYVILGANGTTLNRTYQFQSNEIIMGTNWGFVSTRFSGSNNEVQRLVKLDDGTLKFYRCVDVTDSAFRVTH